MGSLRDQRIYMNSLEKDLGWYRWMIFICALLFILGFIWPQSFLGELRIGSGVIFILMLDVYIRDRRQLRRLKAADARKEYILHKEFRQGKDEQDLKE